MNLITAGLGKKTDKVGEIPGPDDRDNKGGWEKRLAKKQK